MSTNYAFQPETVEALAKAFHKSWGFISNDRCFARQDPVLLQRRLSVCLMQLATDGERDPLLLANAAIYRMRLEYGPEARARLQTMATRAAHHIANPPAESEATADFVKFALTG